MFNAQSWFNLTLFVIADSANIAALIGFERLLRWRKRAAQSARPRGATG